jgi:hypothetical protein
MLSPDHRGASFPRGVSVTYSLGVTLTKQRLSMMFALRPAGIGAGAGAGGRSVIGSVDTTMKSLRWQGRRVTPPPLLPIRAEEDAAPVRA